MKHSHDGGCRCSRVGTRVGLPQSRECLQTARESARPVDSHQRASFQRRVSSPGRMVSQTESRETERARGLTITTGEATADRGPLLLFCFGLTRRHTSARSSLFANRESGRRVQPLDSPCVAAMSACGSAEGLPRHRRYQFLGLDFALSMALNMRSVRAAPR